MTDGHFPFLALVPDLACVSPLAYFLDDPMRLFPWLTELIARLAVVHGISLNPFMSMNLTATSMYGFSHFAMTMKCRANRNVKIDD